MPQASPWRVLGLDLDPVRRLCKARRRQDKALDSKIRMNEVGGDGKLETRSSKPQRLSVTRPGTFRFSMEPIEGFLPVLPREVVIPPGKWVDLTIHLKRSR